MSQGHFGNLCDTNNFGDPVVLYDTFEDRWVITDFAFTARRRRATSSTLRARSSASPCRRPAIPVSGGWNFYSINTTGGLGDYPKFGIWPDGLYMSVNMFDYAGRRRRSRTPGCTRSTRRRCTPARRPSRSSRSTRRRRSSRCFRPTRGCRPARRRPAARTTSPRSGNFLNAVGVYKFHVDWNSISTSTFTGPFNVDHADELEPADGRRDVPSPAQRTRHAVSAADDAEPVQQHRRRRVAVGQPHGRRVGHDVGAGGGALLPGERHRRHGRSQRHAGVHLQPRHARSTASCRASAVDRAGDMAIGYSTSSATTEPRDPVCRPARGRSREHDHPDRDSR